ncbi:hypothetical protein PGH45_18440 [Legionella pneumophila]|nr:hypothetical protein [Legionella pneumophila]
MSSSQYSSQNDNSDHAITALAIARQLGIGDGQQVLTGNELYELNDERFEQLIETVDVLHVQS